jgi:hypothetical protein
VQIKGINYDAGRVFNGMPMRPDFDLQTVHRELQIVKEDIHCNTVTIQGRDPDIANYTLVKLISEGYGTTYPDMTWEPKEAFRAVAEYYGQEN